MFMLSGIFIVMGIVFTCREYRAKCKRQKIEELCTLVHKNVSNNNDLKDSAIMGAASIGLTLLDVYATVSNHMDVLDVLEQRFPNANSGLGIFDWFNKIENMFAGKTESLETYVSCFKGQAAENIAVSLLQNNGVNAELFSSLTHEADDIAVTMSDGGIIPYSVKCGDAFYIKDCIEQSGSTHYIINSESYEILSKSGFLEQCSWNGIEVIDGGYSDTYLEATARGTFQDIHESGNTSDCIPYIALGLLGFKTYQNYKQYSMGLQTGYEFGANFVVDVARVGSAGIFAKLGSDIGMTIGTMMFPGVGTVIGGGIGIFAGALMGNSVFSWAREKIKWGDILKALDYFGNKYTEKFDLSFSRNAVHEYFDYSDIIQKKEEEKKLVDNYKSELDPYSKTEVTLPAVMSQEYLKSIELLEKKINYVTDKLGEEVIATCNRIAEKACPKNPVKFSRRLVGELIVGNSEFLENITLAEERLINGYENQKMYADNYPYQFDDDSDEVLENISRQIFNRYQPSNRSLDRKQLLNRFLIACSFLFAIILFFIQEYFN